MNFPVSGQVKAPGLPDIPEINSDIDFQTFKYKVRISVQGRAGFIEDVITIKSDIISTNDNRKIKIDDLGRIDIIKWEKRRKGSRDIFYPSHYEFFYNDNRKFIVNGNLELLNRLKTGGKKPVYLYLYYYDYIKNGKWINSGAPGSDVVVKRPAAGCVLSIELIR